MNTQPAAGNPPQLGPAMVSDGCLEPQRIREPEARCEWIEPDSIADQLGLRPGDRIARINGQAPRDIIDYQLWTATDELELTVETSGGAVTVLAFEKDPHEDLGIAFEAELFTPLRTCNNGCLFCFVLQAPPGMRPTVYVKDDDYRLSFLHGHFTTLTNLTEPHFQRIVSQRLSPLCVSVHASTPAVRRQLLDNAKADAGWDYLVRLLSAGIECHTQIVCCPGVNDREELDRTVADLAALGPNVVSIGVVPVGLTQYQRHPLMRPMTPAEALDTIARIDHWRVRLGQPENRLVYAADELFLITGQDQPPAEYYDDFPQVENGVGQTRLFLDAAEAMVANLPARLRPARRVVIVTGTYGGVLLQPLADRLNQVDGLTVSLQPVVNRFFGGNVECAGLLTGQDIIAQVGDQPADTLVVLPGRALSDDGLLLDNLGPDDLATRLGCPVTAATTTVELGLACGFEPDDLDDGDGLDWVIAGPG